ncbi:MAG: hypothetical protein P1V13_17165 [Rhizobiaceae bacterium]|nr:hypothetical protein [Rhizobiaceae bacterium]
MLRLLVDFLSGIISVMAAISIIGGAVAGYLQAPVLEVEPWIGGIIGFAAGFLAASLGGGLFACFILIENHLRVLADTRLDEVHNQRPVRQTHEKVALAEETETPHEPTPEELAIERAERVAEYARQYRAPTFEPANTQAATTDVKASTEKAKAPSKAKKSGKADKAD